MKNQKDFDIDVLIAIDKEKTTAVIQMSQNEHSRTHLSAPKNYRSVRNFSK